MASGLAPTKALGDIDWAAPWLASYRAIGEPLARQHVAKGLPIDEVLNTANPPLRFVPQAHLPSGKAYEQFIFESQCVPTRDGLHDFFNGLVWLHFPQSKLRLNQLQAAQIAADGVGAVRGPARDAMTLFDENAALLQAPDVLWESLVQRDWHRLFVDLRPLWAQSRLLLFGHALLEKLVTPRKPITAHVYRVQAGNWALTDVDHWLARGISAQELAHKPFAPMPVLGVPGWWGANEEAIFYADERVFRRARAPADATGWRSDAA